MRNYEQQSSKCLKQQFMGLYHRNMDSKSDKIDWSRGPLQICRSTRIGAATYNLYDLIWWLICLGWLQTSNQFIFFCRLILGKKHIFCFPVRWPDLCLDLSDLSEPRNDPAGGSSVGCIQWGVSWWVQGPPNLQICWLWLAIWSQYEAKSCPGCPGFGEFNERGL